MYSAIAFGMPPKSITMVPEAPPEMRADHKLRREGHVPMGVLASITRGLAGDELTEMAELREAGAFGFTDDGRPVSSAGILRRALQYQRLCGGVLALHEEDPSLSGKGAMHEGEVSAMLGITGGNQRVLLHRGRTRLRAMLAADLGARR